MTNLSGNVISRVWRDGPWVYKAQPKTLVENEVWCLEQMSASGYVPVVERLEMELMRTEYIEPTPVTDPGTFMAHLPWVLAHMLGAGIRHGDLTSHSVIPHNNKPYIIDWAESRLLEDPRPDKRPEGDVYWLTKTMKELCQAS